MDYKFLNFVKKYKNLFRNDTSHTACYRYSRALLQ